jgi:simple sugar transport system permease protein
MNTRLRLLRTQLALPAGAIVLAFGVGAIVMIVTSPLVTGSFDLLLPVEAYWALLQGSILSLNGWIDTLVLGAPLILAGLSVGLCFKAGLFNIGAQGQVLVGGLFAAGVGAALADAPPYLAILAALLAGLVAGAAWGFIPGVLKAFTGAHEVVVTIMLNYIAFQLVAYMVTGPWREPGASFARTPDVVNAALPVLLGPSGHQLHGGMFLALIAVPIVWWILARTTTGFELRTVGANPDAARYAGMRPRFLVVLAMSVGGMLAGAAGAIDILGVTGYMAAQYSTSVGWEAITVALLGRANPFGILLAGLLLGALHAGAPLMQIQAGVPPEMIGIIQGVILFFMAADVIVRRVFRLRAAVGGVEELQTVTRTYGGQTTAP